LKKTLTILLLTSFALASVGCNSAKLTNNTLTQQNQVLSKSVKSDWTANLKPEVKSYYQTAEGKTGEALFDELHTIISKYKNIKGYSESKGYMYEVVDNITMNGTTGILTAYSQVFIPGKGSNGDLYVEQGDQNKDGKSGDFINCEHTWPQSFFNKSLPMVADIHHLQSTLSVPNNRRNNNPFGEVTGKVEYTTSSGSKLGGGVFEPNDADKGNTARAMLYFYTRYYNSNIRSGAFHQTGFWSSKVPMFLKWNKMDPPDANEMRRNDLVQEKQGNRNPFIDAPELADAIGAQVFISKK